MSNLNRVNAVNAVADRLPCGVMPAQAASISYYAEDVFNAESMREYLPKATAEKLIATISGGAALDPSIAGDVAHAMKEWALARGATHYTHWFQPLTGGTAEKHDAFLDVSDKGEAIMAFSGKNLIMGEPDASSFPSGGLRCTFEARGYTAWDPTSPAFIKRHGNGATLCIPTVFCSYTGEVLDKKTPLLRSVQALNRSVRRLMSCFKQPEARTVATLGPEQEYFLIDKKFYLQRPDLVQTGRTLFGAPPPKHQQLEDHYFGSIKPRILAFMTDVEKELWTLGIPAKTRHNEVAPAQFEIAPIFEDLNLAIDHNMLVMEVLRQVADRHGLVCLMHEKPFAGVNGSGKHNNWSVSYGNHNLLDPGKNPHENAIFLTVLSAIIRAVDLHCDLLRSTTAGAGNDHRLGANEAPPAIISIFLGEQLADVINQIKNGAITGSKRPDAMRIGVDSLPTLPRDATDRNRTSPFAFTGNKFEFRAPGSSQSCAEVNTVLNTIVAESLDYLSERLEKLSTADFNTGLQALLKAVIKEHQRIIFNGDNYSADWVKEAEKRGLPNLRDTMEAIKPLLKPENQDIFVRYGVFSKIELASRYEVYMEEYHRRIRIEGGIAAEIARSLIFPVVTEEYRRVLTALNAAKVAGISHGVEGLRISAELLGKGLDELQRRCDELDEALKGMHEGIIVAMESIREIVDTLEHAVDDARWPLPKYREMLFIY
ncbi:glutamine synthetase [Oligosphaera ethanolica]|uniref:Glutamine synthetase n=2 Tax=Oligosphaera ethanolica TaxID=760260 RepID=A0AAE3VE87_9BACT|nr:glutamine synthetase III [Oligosphaera ethanolica]MDQ0288651.1 glutamine synthetase [Oligosphaera ethanolica]